VTREPRPPSGRMTRDEERDILARIEMLGREVYGDDLEAFLATPRRSLDWETPAALLERGDAERVLEVLVRAADGNFG
jgi:Protein of unknown function (DUF2384)